MNVNPMGVNAHAKAHVCADRLRAEPTYAVATGMPAAHGRLCGWAQLGATRRVAGCFETKFWSETDLTTEESLAEFAIRSRPGADATARFVGLVAK